MLSWAISSVGRATALQAVGHKFDPCIAHHFPAFRGRSSVWLERRPVTPEAAGSSPVDPATQPLAVAGFAETVPHLYANLYVIYPYNFLEIASPVSYRHILSLDKKIYYLTEFLIP